MYLSGLRDPASPDTGPALVAEPMARAEQSRSFTRRDTESRVTLEFKIILLDLMNTVSHVSTFLRTLN